MSNFTYIESISDSIRLLNKIIGQYKYDQGRFGSLSSFSLNKATYDVVPSSLEINFEKFLNETERNRKKLIKSKKEQSLLTILQNLKRLNEIFIETSDVRYLNTELKIIDDLIKENWVIQSTTQNILIVRNNIIKSLEYIYDNQKQDIRNFTSNKIFTSNFIECPKTELSKHLPKDNYKKKIVVFSPNPYSIYTLSILHLLHHYNFAIEAVVYKKIFSISRFKSEFSRDGMRLINKIIRKIIFKDSVRINNTSRNLSDVKKELNIECNSIFSFCKKKHINIIPCQSLNDPHVIDVLKSITPDYGIFTGGGIVSSDVINKFKVGIINCHAGLLPHYRGMDVIEWPFLTKAHDHIGCTTHFMSKKIDQGSILYAHKLKNKLDIKSARYQIESIAPYLQILTLLDSIAELIPAKEQKGADGKLYYVMHSWFFNKALDISKNQS